MPNRTDYVNDNLTLTQKTEGLTFGTDALLLAAYVGGKANRAVELGCGTGILSLLLLTRGKADCIEAVEVQEEYASLAAENAEKNRLSAKMNVICADLRDLHPDGTFDLCVTNPPYMKCGHGAVAPTEKKAIARHELHGGILDFCLSAGKFLRTGGRFCAVFRPERLCEMTEAMREAGIEPKRLTFVHPDLLSPASLFLIEGKRGAAASLFVTRPLVIYPDKSHKIYTPDMNFIMENGIFPADYFGKQTKEAHPHG